MAVRYLLDTNTASYVIKGNFPRVRARLLKVPMAEVGISVVTEAELRFGVARRPEATSLKSVVEEFLLRVRSILHLESRRNQNVLGHELQEKAAQALRYPGTSPRQQVERLMSDYFRHARNVRKCACGYLAG